MPPDSPKGRPHHRHSERRGAKQSEAPRIEEPVLQRREATPLMLLRLGVGCLVEALFERVPPLRAFGPPVGMTAVGGLYMRWVAWPRKAWPWDDERPPASPGHAHPPSADQRRMGMPPGNEGQALRLG